MTNRKSKMVRRLASTALAVLSLGFFDRANADVIPLSFTTSGTFSPGTPPELTYTPTSFSGVTDASGFLLLPDLGGFGLSIPADPAKFNGFTFTLHLDFVDPAGVFGPVDFVGAISGHANDHSNSKLHINFNPNSTDLSFANSQASGSFTLAVDDIKGLEKDSTETLTGNLSNAVDPPAAVPEPQTLFLLGSALIGIASRRRLWRNRRSRTYE